MTISYIRQKNIIWLSYYYGLFSLTLLYIKIAFKNGMYKIIENHEKYYNIHSEIRDKSNEEADIGSMTTLKKI